MCSPEALAVDSKGNILVVDDDTISKFTTEGLFLGSEENSFNYSIAVNASNGRVYFGDGSSIYIMTLTIGDIHEFGSSGYDEGQFNDLRQIACDSTENVYVADSGNNRIQVFTAEGKFLRIFGSEGDVKGQLSEPYGVAIDATGKVYVSERGNHRISVFNLEGQFMTSFCSEGKELGQFQEPAGLTVDTSGILYVCDSGNGRVQLF